MNEEFVSNAYSFLKSKGYNGDVESFKQNIASSDEFVSKSYEILSSNGYDGDVDSFKSMVGFSSSEESKSEESESFTNGSVEQQEQPTEPLKESGVVSEDLIDNNLNNTGEPLVLSKTKEELVADKLYQESIKEYSQEDKIALKELQDKSSLPEKTIDYLSYQKDLDIDTAKKSLIAASSDLNKRSELIQQKQGDLSQFLEIVKKEESLLIKEQESNPDIVFDEIYKSKVDSIKEMYDEYNSEAEKVRKDYLLFYNKSREVNDYSKFLQKKQESIDENTREAVKDLKKTALGFSGYLGMEAIGSVLNFTESFLIAGTAGFAAQAFDEEESDNSFVTPEKIKNKLSELERLGYSESQIASYKKAMSHKIKTQERNKEIKSNLVKFGMDRVESANIRTKDWDLTNSLSKIDSSNPLDYLAFAINASAEVAPQLVLSKATGGLGTFVTTSGSMYIDAVSRQVDAEIERSGSTREDAFKVVMSDTKVNKLGLNAGALVVAGLDYAGSLSILGGASKEAKKKLVKEMLDDVVLSRTGKILKTGKEFVEGQVVEVGTELIQEGVESEATSMSIGNKFGEGLKEFTVDETLDLIAKVTIGSSGPQVIQAVASNNFSNNLIKSMANNFEAKTFAFEQIDARVLKGDITEVQADQIKGRIDKKMAHVKDLSKMISEDKIEEAMVLQDEWDSLEEQVSTNQTGLKSFLKSKQKEVQTKLEELANQTEKDGIQDDKTELQKDGEKETKEEVDTKRDDIEKRRQEELLEAPNVMLIAPMISDGKGGFIENPDISEANKIIDKINAKYDAEIAALGETTPSGKVSEEVDRLRAEEQSEMLKEIPNAEDALTDGKVDREKLPTDEGKAKFDEIYNKYDKLISPLLEDVDEKENVEPLKEVVDDEGNVYDMEAYDEAMELGLIDNDLIEELESEEIRRAYEQRNAELLEVATQQMRDGSGGLFSFLAQNLGRIRKEDFDLYGDPNLRKGDKSFSVRFLSKKAMPLDVTVKELSEEYGVEITPQDAIDYILDRQGNPDKYKSSKRKLEALNKASNIVISTSGEAFNIYRNLDGSDASMKAIDDITGKVLSDEQAIIIKNYLKLKKDEKSSDSRASESIQQPDDSSTEGGETKERGKANRKEEITETQQKLIDDVEILGDNEVESYVFNSLEEVPVALRGKAKKREAQEVEVKRLFGKTEKIKIRGDIYILTVSGKELRDLKSKEQKTKEKVEDLERKIEETKKEISQAEEAILEYEAEKVEEANKKAEKLLEDANKTIEDEITEEEAESVSEELGISKEESKTLIAEAVKEDLSESPSVKKRNSALQKIVDRIVKYFKIVILTSSLYGSIASYSNTNQTFSINNLIENSLSILPNYMEESAVRFLVKKGLYDYSKNEETISISEIKEAPKEIKESSSDSAYEQAVTYTEVIGKVKDSHYRARKNVSDSLLLIRNQFLNKNGFTYVSGPVKSNINGNEKIKGVEGVAHFMILDTRGGADLTKKTDRAKLIEESNKFKEEIKKRNPNAFVPVFEILPENNVNVKYKKAKDLTSKDIAITRLSQWKFGDIDFNGRNENNGISGASDLTTKNGSRVGSLLVTSKGKDAYSRFSGGSVVFIFSDSKGNEIIRDFTGSINAIEREGNGIAESFGISKDDITIASYDAGSYTAKPSAKDGVIETDQYKGYNILHPNSAGSLMIPISTKSNPGTGKQGALESMLLALVAIKNKRKRGKAIVDKDINKLKEEIKKAKEKLENYTDQLNKLKEDEYRRRDLKSETKNITEKVEDASTKTLSETEKKSIAEKVGRARKVKAKNVSGLIDVMAGIFGLNKNQAEGAAIVGDVIIGNAAKRAGISKDEMYQKIAFAKAQMKDLPQGVKFQVDAWHGSPYQFDKFLLSEIGTGEGAQAFGWGLYFTDLKSIAKNYAEVLSKKKPSKEILDEIFKINVSNYYDSRGYRGDFSENLFFAVKEDFSNLREISDSEVLIEIKNALTGNPNKELNEATKKAIQDNADVLNKLIPNANVYKVSLHKGKTPDQYTWLEWDKRVSSSAILKLAKAFNIPIKVDDSKVKNIRRRLEEAINKGDSDLVDSLDLELLEAEYDFSKNGIDPILSEIFSKEGINLVNADGKFIYEQISRKLKSDKDASLFLLSAGIDGIKYPAESIARGATSDTARGFNYVVFDENAVSIEEVVKFQKDAEKARGAMMMAMDNQAIIYAITDPNVSTPLHELAHVYEHYLTDKERADIESWSGHKSGTVEFSEAFARGFEKFLSEGKVSNPKLKSIFSNFANWLMEIYNGIKGSDIDLKLNKKMKSIYDQMLSDAPSIDKIYEDSNKAILDKAKKLSIRDRTRLFREKFLDRQTRVKDLMKGISSKEARKSMALLVTKAGAGGYANFRFKKADKKIYDGLSKLERATLDKIIYVRRIISINENRKKDGRDLYVGKENYSGDEASLDLQKIEANLGVEKFLDLSSRADEYFSVFDESLKRMRDSKLISEEVYNNLKDYEYSPIKTIKYLIPEGTVQDDIDRIAIATGVTSDAIKKLGDSNQSDVIMDSRWLLMTNLSMVEGIVFENRLLDSFSEAIDSATDSEKQTIGEYVLDNPVVETKVDKDGNKVVKRKYDLNKIPIGFRKVSFKKDGVDKYMVVQADYANQLLDIKNKPGSLEKVIPKITFTGVLRFFATSGNPLFIVGNTAIDFQNILFLSDVYSNNKMFGGFQLAFDFLKSTFGKVFSMDKYNKSYEEFMIHGGSIDYLSADGLQAIKNSLWSNNQIIDAGAKVIKGYGALMSYLGETSEVAFRIAVFEKSKANQIKQFKKDNKVDPNEQDMEDIMFEAAREARETIDFNQGGSITKSADKYLPYLNAATQGARKAIDYSAKNPKQFVSNMIQLSLMSGTTMAASLFMLFKGIGDDEDEKEKVIEVFNSISEHEKANYHILFTGKRKENGEFEYYRFKKLPQVAAVSTMAEQLVIKAVLKHKGIDYDFDVKTVQKSLKAAAPIIPTPKEMLQRNPAVSAFITYTFNEDLFYGKKIFNAPIGKKIDPTAEGIYDPKVNQIYKDIATAIGMSPIRSKAAMEKIITSETTNPMIGLFYSGYDALLKENTSMAEDLSNTFDKLIDNSSKKLLRSTNKNLIKYKEEAESELEETVIETEIYKKEQKVYNEIKSSYEKGDTLTRDDIKSLIEDKFDRKDWKKYVDKYSNYLYNKDIDRSLLDLLYEDTPEVQALMMFNRYGDRLKEDGIDELKKAYRGTQRKPSRKAIMIYKEKYLDKK